jgi:hypothetical protein
MNATETISPGLELLQKIPFKVSIMVVRKALLFDGELKGDVFDGEAGGVGSIFSCVWISRKRPTIN